MDSVLRAAAIYAVLLLLFRLTGRRSLAETSPFDLVLLLVIGEATQQALLGDDFSITNALLVIITLFFAEQVLSLFGKRLSSLDKIIEGRPVVIVENGRPLKERLERSQVDEGDVLESAREMRGIERLEQIKYAVLERDGSIPKDNPFVGKTGVRPEIWSYGHRNIQAATLHPTTGELWEVEHGTRGGDEMNIAQKGKDYGWPSIAYGIEYQGGPILEGLTAKEGMEQPKYYWDPNIAPSGMTFYTGDLFPVWKGNLFIGGLGSTSLVRLVVDNQGKVSGEERLLRDVKDRFRDVEQGPDGALYLLTDNAKGRVLKLVAKR